MTLMFQANLGHAWGSTASGATPRLRMMMGVGLMLILSLIMEK